MSLDSSERERAPEIKVRSFRAPKHPHLFEALGKQRIGKSFCFLCGRRLTPNNRSDEHVFPKWVLHRYELWDLELTLLNRTRIRYRSLFIPCCKLCNTRYLAPIENRVKRAVSKGPSAVRRLSDRTLFLWLGKILYGILYKEGLLKADRSKPKSGRLVPRRLLENFRTHHLFLQGARIPMRFVGAFPASIFVYRLQKSQDRRFHFNLRDMPATLSIAIQMGAVGVIASLQDGGSQRAGFASYLDRYHRYPLHPLQFLELIAAFFYKSTLFNRTPKYMTIESDRALEVNQLPLQGFSMKPLFDDWDQAAYAHLLSFHTGVPYQEVFRPPESVMTWLNDNQGEPSFLDIKKAPWAPGPLPGNVAG